MYLLNLSLVQFVAVFGSIAAVAVALYLFDPSRRRLTVSTLLFWAAGGQPTSRSRRRHIQQPWSLVLQLAGMALLLLAIAQLRVGRPPAPRDHVIVLDTSAWMGARSGSGTLMDIARRRARQYLDALPAEDRVMLVRADALSTPATAFEPDHRKVRAAINASQPGATALRLAEALAFARQIQARQGRRAGEIAYVGAGRIAQRDGGSEPRPPANLRVLAIPDRIENRGLHRVGLRRSPSDPDLWRVYVSAHNYGAAPHPVRLSLEFTPAGSATPVAVGAQQLTLAPAADGEAAFAWRTAEAGTLSVQLQPPDAFPADDRAEVEVPAQSALNVVVYTNQPDLFRPLFAGMPHVSTVYRKPGSYVPGDGGLVVLDRFIPPLPPTADSVWIDPPAGGSPIPVRTTVTAAPFVGWEAEQTIAAGLRTKDFRLEKATVFEAAPTDLAIGRVQAGPVIVARPGNPKVAVLGFQPALSAMRYELATPLLFANLLRWVQPEIFRRLEAGAGSVGTAQMELDRETPPAGVKVLAANGEPLPFSLRGRTLNFFTGGPGAVRVIAGDRESVVSLTLPEVGEEKWEAPSSVLRGIPRAAPLPAGPSEWWPWLALAGGALLLAEWLLFARPGRGRPVAMLRHSLLHRVAKERT